MKTFWKALGIAALAAVIPVRVSKDKQTGKKALQSLLWKLDIIPNKDGTDGTEIGLDLMEGVLTAPLMKAVTAKKEAGLFADDEPEAALVASDEEARTVIDEARAVIGKAQAAVNEAQAAANEAQAAADEAQAAVDEAQATADGAQAAAAEQARAAAEQARIAAEQARTAAEQARIAAEEAPRRALNQSFEQRGIHL